MCEAKVYILNNGVEELIMEDVDKAVPSEDDILLENILGQQKIVKARIKQMNLTNHKIILEKIE